MSSSNQGLENIAQAEDGVAPLPNTFQSFYGDTTDNDDEPWLRLNLLSLDGGGIRGLWSLLALQMLMDYIGAEEEKQGCYESFCCPGKVPDNFCHAPLTEAQRFHIDAVYNPEEKFRREPCPRRYLPCHYFDYICGSSTGGLIAIMLGRFRMTVPDCISEYQKLGQEVFGKPRMISTLRFGLGQRHKYKAARLEKVFKNVAKRRNEKPEPSETGKITFPTGQGLCATFVTTLKAGKDRRSASLYLIRSYNHTKHDSPDSSKRPTPRQTMGSGRTNTGISTNTTTAQRKIRKNKAQVEINYEKAHQFEVWEVARAATAAKFYFEPLKIENPRSGESMEFTDGGLGYANNPTRVGKQEIQDLNGDSCVGIVVSIGTARKHKEDAKKANFFSTIPDSAREFADKATDPEIVHHDIDKDNKGNKEFPYYRLNHPGGLQTELDEWKPKRKMFKNADGGATTIKDIQTAFHAWAAERDNIEHIQKCASALVECKTARMKTRKWERYATGACYECRFKGCNPGDFFDQYEFEKHLTERHGLEGDELETEVAQCRRHWRYQAAPNR